MSAPTSAPFADDKSLPAQSGVDNFPFRSRTILNGPSLRWRG